MNEQTPHPAEKVQIATLRGIVRMAALVVMDQVGETDKGLAAAIASKASIHLRDHVAALLAEAWDEGAEKASPHGGGYLRSLLIENPYREVVTPAGKRGAE